MDVNRVRPAAQYLRMSTEHQRYSLENQAAAIQRYGESNGFWIVETYCDAAKSGLVLRHRTGLQKLLRDVVTRTSRFKAILVYDVSRWGRFQDTDEAAHYEFICKSAGVPVHYCAETFANDGSMASLVMKALKRTMAGEYSRELGNRVLAGQTRLARLGFKQGGRPGYGLRRFLISADGTPKQELAAGERKSVTTDRVILVPGPAHEVERVRWIYRMLINEKWTVHQIAGELTDRGIQYVSGSKWDYLAVFNILSHPKYSGCHVFRRTSRKLCTPSVRIPKSDWILTPGAFAPIVDQSTFDEAQRILENRTIKKSNDVLLDDLRSLLAARGRLSYRIIQDSDRVASPSVYRNRFGSLRRAYERIGYGKATDFGPIDLRRRTRALREDLLRQIVALFPEQASIVRRGARWRSRLRLRGGVAVSVLVVRSVRTWKTALRWRVDPVRRECKLVTLLARLDESNSDFIDLHVLPGIENSKRFHLKLEDTWLNQGLRLNDLAEFCSVVERVVTDRATACSENRTKRDRTHKEHRFPSNLVS